MFKNFVVKPTERLIVLLDGSLYTVLNAGNTLFGIGARKLKHTNRTRPCCMCSGTVSAVC